jgi:hypothetical protein
MTGRRPGSDDKKEHDDGHAPLSTLSVGNCGIHVCGIEPDPAGFRFQQAP